MHIIKRLQQLFNQPKKPVDLAKLKRVEAFLGSPTASFRSIHVAGTNGKGSVCHKLAACLQENGLQVGLYTSPHLFDIRERIVLNDHCIAKEDFEKGLSRVFEASDACEYSLHFFEVLTLVAFCYYAEKKVDVAVIEVGKGGRHDATNVIDPLLSIITSIGLDHTAELGHTRELIAIEKGGIIKPHVPVILGPKANLPILHQIALEKESPCHVVEGDYGNYEEENRAIADKALNHLPFSLLSKNGLEKTPACRFQIIQKQVPIILDVGHNPPALEALFKRVKATFPHSPIYTLFAISSDKDVGACLDILIKESFHTIFTEAKSSRAKPIDQLLRMVPEGCKGIKNPLEAFHAIQEKALELKGVAVVCGTFYLIEHLFKYD